MSIFFTIIAVIVIFSLLVLIHEYGHFTVARRSGIKVLEFGIGFPPRLFKKKIGETVYSINAIPFGGFVKLFGEDSSDEKILKNKRSFANQTPWIRTKVVIAGVAMNFLLAIVLLTIGFLFGIEPLLVTEADLLTHLAQGNVKSEPGIFVAKVDEQTKALGISPKDQLLAIDDQLLREAKQVSVFQKGKATKDIDVMIKTPATGDIKKIHLPLVGKKGNFGIDLKPFTEFPRMAILEVKKDSNSEKAGLKPDDIILQMNGLEIYSAVDFEKVMTEESSIIRFTILRGDNALMFSVGLPDTRRIVISEVFKDSRAKKTGFQKGDIILSINGIAISKPEQVQGILRKNPRQEMIYRLERRLAPLEIKASADEKNLLGIALSSIVSFRNNELSLYRSNLLTSITEVRKVRYSPWKAFSEAISESVRLTGITVGAFGRTLGSLVSKLTVPEEIGGPIQIAYYTHTFVKEGFFALLRFTALLSLSLGVINVLPIPALDGGRLLFILIEVIFKKRVNARLESLVHSIGFVLLLLLIILVTYSDITKLF